MQAYTCLNTMLGPLAQPPSWNTIPLSVIYQDVLKDALHTVTKQYTYCRGRLLTLPRIQEAPSSNLGSGAEVFAVFTSSSKEMPG
jgi:hypothetical protein